jgi:hypothetical protein
MDPYLEQEVLWHDFHEKFIPAAAAQVLPRYIVLIIERPEAVLTAPTQIALPDVVVEQASDQEEPWAHSINSSPST